jgi:WD40 repeat protein
MAQVEAMLRDKFSKNTLSTNSETPVQVTENKKKKKKKQQQAVHESQQLSSRSAESGKTSAQSRLQLSKASSNPDLLHDQERDDSVFSPIQPLHPFELSQDSVAQRQQPINSKNSNSSSSIATSTNDSLFPELRTGKSSGSTESPQKSSKNPVGGRKKSNEDVAFPPIVKPERVPLNREPTAHFEEFESAALNTIIPNEDEESAVARHKDEAEGNLTLKHVHGYDGSGGTGKNIHWLSRSVVAFPAVALVVLMNVNSSKQQFYKGHTNEVTSLAIHPDKKIIASGQLGKEGRILVWDSTLMFQKKPQDRTSPIISPTKPLNEADQSPDMNVLQELLMEKTKGILGVDFSGDGRLLVAIGMDDSTPVSVFDWNRGVVLANVSMGHTEIYQIGFNKFLFNTQTDGVSDQVEKKFCYTLVSCGSRSVKFWSLRRVCEQVGAGAVVKKGKGGFKGRQLAVPKNKQKWQWTHTLEGNTGNIPKKQATTSVEMTCFSAISEPFVEGKHRLPQAKILTGASNGCVYIWQQQEVSIEGADDDGYSYWQPRGSLLCVVSDVHDGPIFDLDYFHSNTRGDDGASLHRVATCSKDGTVNLWELDSSNPAGSTSPMQHLSVVNIAGSDAYLGQPRSITYSSDGKALVVGTTNNCICTLAGSGVKNQGEEGEDGGENIRLHNIISSNYGKGRHVAPHPFMDMCASVSSDKTLRLWSVKAAAQVAYTRISGCGSSLTFTPDGSSVAIGTETGEVLILTCTYLQFCRDNDAEPGPDQKKPRWDILGRKFVGAKGGAGGKKDISKTEITALKYSPSGDVLAVATRDKIIHLLSAAVSNVISVSASFMILISLIFVIMFSRTRTVISAQLLARGIAVPLSALISRTMECCCRHLTVCGKLYSGKLQQESL